MTRVLILAITIITGLASTAVAQQDALSFDQRLSGYDYPFPVKTYDFRSQGHDLEMAYMHLPPTTQGMPNVVLLHGKNFNGAYWQRTAKWLQSLGYGVVMPDQIGFGKSSKPKDYQYSFAALANNTHGLLESLGIEKPIVVGHSMGGMLASRYTLLYPDSTQQLILVNPIGLENYLQYVQYKDVDFFFQNELQQTPEKIVAYQKKNYYDGAWNEQYAALTEPLVGWVQGPDWKDLAYVNALTYDMIFTQPVVEEFKDFQVPATLIVGTRDRTGPGRNWKRDGVEYELGRYDAIGPKIKGRNPDIDVIELPGLGHLPQIENFEMFQEAFKLALPK
ncbi:alpha/beta hydrolase [Bremerella cremea]|uniref:Alpha/beta hydrolase n=1 Tax=Blastopirellula marina TaxID=124 RepID=A0A2S8FDW8_9BACT|nr:MULTISPECIES: alpha/beta hydrolase [Pirellulaceae]PQO30356.1 alpha/beta hydrolase [Blastopirellula marina]RCS43707.1 alpha/beta hydrolase [Bremerella cremea]